MKLTIFVVWACSLAIAFIVGRTSNIDANHHFLTANHGGQTGLDLSQNKMATNSDSRLTNKKPQMFGEYLNESLKEDVLSSQQTSALSPAQRIQEIRNRLTSESIGYDFEAMSRAYAVVDQMSQAELQNTLAELAKYGQDNDYYTTINMVLEKYASFAPADAMAFISEHISASGKQRHSSIKVLGKWANTDPIAAFNWHRQQDVGSRFFVNGPQLTTIFKGLAKQNTELAFEYLEQLPNSESYQSSAASGIASRLTESHEFVALIEKTKDLAGDQFDQSVFYQWINQDEQGLIDYVNNIDDTKQRSKSKKILFNISVNSATKRDISEFADAYLAEANQNQVNNRVRSIVQSWGGHAPQQALNWVNQQIGIDKSAATWEVMRRASVVSPAFARQHLDLVESPKRRNQLVANIYSSLKRTAGLQEADNFVSSLPNSDEVMLEVKAQEARRLKAMSRDR